MKNDLNDILGAVRFAGQRGQVPQKAFGKVKSVSPKHAVVSVRGSKGTYTVPSIDGLRANDNVVLERNPETRQYQITSKSAQPVSAQRLFIAYPDKSTLWTTSSTTFTDVGTAWRLPFRTPRINSGVCPAA